MKIVDLKEKYQLFEERCNELEAKEREMDFAKRELESKQKQLDDRIRELELKEKKLANIIKIRVGADQSEGNSPSLDLGFVVTMFGKGLQLFLNEHVKYHDSIAGKVLEALKHSIDPSKLVVDAMEGFYPPHLKKGNFEFEGSVVRRSCILLLEQIMKISPTIRTDVKEAALGIAAEWKTKMKPVVENWLEVLGFLCLLAAYELGGDFDVDELLSLYKIVPQHKQTPELFALLDFTDEIGGGGATSKQRKRSLDLSECYDSARNAARKSRLPPKQLIPDKIPNVSTFKFGGLNDHQSTDLPDGCQSFWTCCPFCTIKYKDFVNRSLRCQNCSKHFIAYDLGAQGAPPVSNQANTGSNRGQPQVSQQKQVPTKSCKLGARSSGPFNSYHLRSVVNSSRKMGSEHVSRTSGTAEVGDGLKNNVKGIAHVNTEEGNTVDAAKTRESGTSRDGKRKRGRPPKRSHENTVEFDKKAVTLESCANKFNVIYDSESKPNLGSTSDPEFYECPDPEFSDFDKDKDEKCFSVDQIWACYDTVDGMPRFYAKVKKVLSRGFKLRITWLEADPEEQGEIDWVNEGLPVCCGKFTRGDTEETSDRLSFSHLIHFEKGIGRGPRGSYLIYPRSGETWALFKNWEIGWSTDSENHKKYIFEIVEILSDFSNVTGIKVGYLRKMEGFVSMFQRIRLGGDAIFVIPSSEMLRFSHRIPSFKMTGAESEGVPEGSFELDPSALPTNLKELWQPEEEKVEAQSIAC